MDIVRKGCIGNTIRDLGKEHSHGNRFIRFCIYTGLVWAVGGTGRDGAAGTVAV